MSNTVTPPSYLYAVVFGRKGEPNYRIESVHTDPGDARTAVDNHPHRNSQITRAADKARVIPVNLGVLAWDLSDAFADDELPFNFGMDEIETALPAIITLLLAQKADS